MRQRLRIAIDYTNYMVNEYSKDGLIFVYHLIFLTQLILLAIIHYTQSSFAQIGNGPALIDELRGLAGKHIAGKLGRNVGRPRCVKAVRRTVN